MAGFFFDFRNYIMQAQPTEKPTYEVVLLDRDKNGNPTGRKVSCQSDDSKKIYSFFIQHHQTMMYRAGKKNKRAKDAKRTTNNK